MKFRKGIPKQSGEYIVAMKTAAGTQIDIVNFGETEKGQCFYTVEDGEIVVLDNVTGWMNKPSYEEGI